MSASGMRRVLMLVENNSYPRDTRVRQEAEALTAAGYRVAVVAPRAPGRPWRETMHGVSLYGYPAPRPGNGLLGYLWEYGYSFAAAAVLSLWVLVDHGFDVILAANPPDTFWLLAAPYRLFGRRFIYDHHDLAPEMYGARFDAAPNPVVLKILLLFERLSYRVAHHVIVTNRSYRDLAVERGGLRDDQVTIVRNGPDLGILREVPPHPEVLHPGKTIIGYVGSIGFHDGVDYLLRALDVLVHDLGRTDFHCLVVGAGDALGEMRALATTLEIDRYVTFTGWVAHQEVAAFLAAADICVAPEPSNAYNDRCTVIKMMEYMALGKPIVAFDLPEHRYSAQDAALYAPANSTEEMARRIAELMDDPARRAEMGARGVQRVRDELAWNHQKPHLLRALERVTQPESHHVDGGRTGERLARE